MPTRPVRPPGTLRGGAETSRLKHVLTHYRRRPSDPYWCLRLCEEVRPNERKDLAQLWASALARLASYDPTWFVSCSLSDMGALGILSAPKPDLARVEKLVSIRDSSLADYVVGVLWSSALRFKKPPSTKMRHAANLLVRVDERHRSAGYYEHVCYALEHGDYAKLKEFFAPLVAGALRTRAESSLPVRSLVAQGRLVFVLVAAARAGDWETYDAYRERYEDGADPNRDCKIWNCDGLRELAYGRDEHLQEILQHLMQRAANVKFLGTSDHTAFVDALIERGRFLDDCHAYLSAARRNGGVAPAQPSDEPSETA